KALPRRLHRPASVPEDNRLGHRAPPIGITRMTVALTYRRSAVSARGRPTADGQRWLAFTLHAFLARRFGLAGFSQCSVDDLDLAAALIVRDHDARARDA